MYPAVHDNDCHVTPLAVKILPLFVLVFEGKRKGERAKKKCWSCGRGYDCLNESFVPALYTPSTKSSHFVSEKKILLGSQNLRNVCEAIRKSVFGVNSWNGLDFAQENMTEM